MKKLLSFLSIIALITSLAVSGLATPSSFSMIDTLVEQDEITITPFYLYTENIVASLSFSGNTAYCNGTVVPSGKNSATVTVTLYKQNGDGWGYVTSWFGSATNGTPVSAGGSYPVGSGTYKVVAIGNVGNGLERPSKSVTKTK